MSDDWQEDVVEALRKLDPNVAYVRPHRPSYHPLMMAIREKVLEEFPTMEISEDFRFEVTMYFDEVLGDYKLKVFHFGRDRAPLVIAVPTDEELKRFMEPTVETFETRVGLDEGFGISATEPFKAIRRVED